MRALTWFLQAALFLITVILFGLEAFLEPVLHFALGWVFSSARLINAFEGSLAPLWWILASVGLVIGAHLFLASWKHRVLKWRTSFAAVGVLLLAVLSGMTIAGTIHQVAWLATSSEPWIHSFRGSREEAYLRHAATFIDDLLERPMKVEVWNAHWRTPREIKDRASMHDMFATSVSINSDGEVTEVIVWPRDTRTLDRVGGYVVPASADPDPYRAPELIEILKQRRGGKRER